MFSCVWLHFKKCFEKYSLVFGCVLKNTIENTFSTCCSHFLTFSQLPNEYIISFIPQYRNTNKTQKKKKKSSNPDTSRDRDQREGEVAIGAVLCAIGHEQRLSTLSSFFLPLSLSLALSLSLLCVTRKWFEGKMKV